MGRFAKIFGKKQTNSQKAFMNAVKAQHKYQNAESMAEDPAFRFSDASRPDFRSFIPASKNNPKILQMPKVPPQQKFTEKYLRAREMPTKWYDEQGDMLQLERKVRFNIPDWISQPTEVSAEELKIVRPEPLPETDEVPLYPEEIKLNFTTKMKELTEFIEEENRDAPHSMAALENLYYSMKNPPLSLQKTISLYERVMGKVTPQPGMSQAEVEDKLNEDWIAFRDGHYNALLNWLKFYKPEVEAIPDAFENNDYTP